MDFREMKSYLENYLSYLALQYGCDLRITRNKKLRELSVDFWVEGKCRGKIFTINYGDINKFIVLEIYRINIVQYIELSNILDDEMNIQNHGAVITFVSSLDEFKKVLEVLERVKFFEL